MKKLTLLFFFTIIIQLSFSQELALARQEGKFGFINKLGEWHIKPQYEKAKGFYNDFAAVFVDGKWGFIDRKGNLAIPAEFNRIKKFNSGIAVVNKNDEWVYINKEGKQVLKDVPTDKIYDFENGYAIIRQEDKLGFINAEGKVIVSPKYMKVKKFVNGYAKVLFDGKWGLIDEQGNEFIKPEYNRIGNMYHGKIVAQKDKDGNFGIIINKQFKPIEGTKRIWDFSLDENLTYAEKDKEIGFINSNGEWVIKPEYEKARAFSNGLAPVHNGKKWGYIDVTGKIVIPFEYKDAEVFSNDGLAPVMSKKQWGFINKKGEMVIPEKYQITSKNFKNFIGGSGFVTRHNGFMVQNGQNQVRSKILSNIKIFSSKGFYDGLARVKEGKKWLFIDTNGNVLNNQVFENLEIFN